MPVLAYCGQSGDDAEIVAEKFAKTLTQDSIIFWADPSLKRLEKMLDTQEALWVVTPTKGTGDPIEASVNKLFVKKHTAEKSFSKQLILGLYTVLSTNKDDVSLIASTPQGFALTDAYLNEHFPDTSRKEFTTFSEAAEFAWSDDAKKDRPKKGTIAVICTEYAAKSREMKCIAKDIQTERPKIEYEVWRK